MEVIAQHGKAKDIDAELAGQELHAVLNPLPAMLEVFAGDGIFAAQERAPDAAIDAMVDSNFGGIEKKPTANSRHGKSPAESGKWAHMGTQEHYVFLCPHILPMPTDRVKDANNGGTIISQSAQIPPRLLGGTQRPHRPSLLSDALVRFPAADRYATHKAGD
jgi:hypothetical protein